MNQRPAPSADESMEATPSSSPSKKSAVQHELVKYNEIMFARMNKMIETIQAKNIEILESQQIRPEVMPLVKRLNELNDEDFGLIQSVITPQLNMMIKLRDNKANSGLGKGKTK